MATEAAAADTPAIAFFPWVVTYEVTEIGPVRLIPYVWRKSPGDTPLVKQSDIDGVLSAYANRPRSKVRHATLLEYGDWKLGADATAVAPTLLKVRHLIAFSALSGRRLFARSYRYSNTDTYALILQRYLSGDASTFAFSTRRRDGGGQHLWSSREFAHYRPNHVDGDVQLQLDIPLLRALLRVALSDKNLYEALSEFNFANTDSPDVPLHVEVVMIKSAFEWLFQIDQNATALVNAIMDAIADTNHIATFSGPMLAKWKDRYPKAKRPLEAWAREFCIVRNAAAHGKDQSGAGALWSEFAHLAFAALLFPLMVKKVLANSGNFELSDFDVEQLRRLDGYLAHDPTAYNWLAAGDHEQHPWHAVHAAARVKTWSRQLYAEVARAAPAAGGNDAPPAG